MPFFDDIKASTLQEQAYLFEASIIKRCFTGDDLTLDDYGAFLLQAYHHVKHTVPLLMAVGAKLREDQEWLRMAVAEYIEEELGHQEWILNDLAACGYSKDKARASTPNLATELMVAYAYDTIQRVNPLGFFGMVHVLEGTSITTADGAADNIQRALGLPDKAFSYLRSHGALDQDHVKFFEGLMNKLDSDTDKAQIIHSTKAFYTLYGNVFRSMDAQQCGAIKP